MEWVTRERPKTDRIARPWLIRRFSDPEAELLHLPADRIFAMAAATGAPPCAIPGADAARHDPAPEASGLPAVSLGLSAMIPDDHAMLEQGMVLYDALHAWCRRLRDEAHNRTPPQRKAPPAPGGVP